MGTGSIGKNAQNPKNHIQPFSTKPDLEQNHFLNTHRHWLKKLNHLHDSIKCLQWGLILTVLCSLLIVPSQLLADSSLTLAWAPAGTGAQGYRLFQRIDGQNYDYSQWVYQGPNLSYTVNGLLDDATYHFVVRAYSGDEQSADSNEILYSLATSDQAPVADAGPTLAVSSQTHVVLDGSGSSDPSGSGLSYQWVLQDGDPSVSLSNAHTAYPEFTAPAVTEGSIFLRFELTVTNAASVSATDTCMVQVYADSADTDGDGMPDSWELQYGFDPLDSTDAALDADNDGMANVDEYQNGTNPLITDENRPPATPVMISPENSASEVTCSPKLVASAFEDPNAGDSHSASQWRIQTMTDQQTVFEAIVQKGHLTDIKVPPHILNPSTGYIAQVRYFDNSDQPSEWSDLTAFTTAADIQNKNKNRTPDTQEVTETTDLNRDNIPDSDQTETLARFKTYNGDHIVGLGIETSDGVIAIESAANTDPAELVIDAPSAGEMPYGLLSYRIRLSEPGQSAHIHLFLSDAIDPQTPWVRYDNELGLQDCSDRVVVAADGYSVERELFDGGEGDLDGTVNGVIVDLTGPSEYTSEDHSLGGDGSGSSESSSTCFIQTLF